MPGIKGHVVNPPGHEKWALAVGKFIINFGAIETLTYQWVRKLSGDVSVLDEALEKLFAARVRIVRGILDTLTIPDDLRTETEEAWTEATDLADVRNRIAHNAVTFAWKGREEEGEPDVIGLLDYKSASGDLRTIINYIDYDKLIEMGNETCRVAQRLQAALDRLPQHAP